MFSWQSDRVFNLLMTICKEAAPLHSEVDREMLILPFSIPESDINCSCVLKTCSRRERALHSNNSAPLPNPNKNTAKFCLHFLPYLMKTWDKTEIFSSFSIFAASRLLDMESQHTTFRVKGGENCQMRIWWFSGPIWGAFNQEFSMADSELLTF